MIWTQHCLANDHYRLKLQPNAVDQFVAYALPSTPTGSTELKALSLKVSSFRNTVHTANEFKIWTSADGTAYTELPVVKTAAGGTEWRKFIYQTDSLPADAKYFKVTFPEGDGLAQLGDVEIVYNHTSGESLIYKDPISNVAITSGVLTDEMNNMLKMADHSANLGTASDNPQYFGNDVKRLQRTANNAESFVYHTAGDMNYFIMTGYARQESSKYRVPNFTFQTSPDGENYTTVNDVAVDEVPGEGFWSRMVFTGLYTTCWNEIYENYFPSYPIRIC